MLAELKSFVRANVDSHLQIWTEDLETHLTLIDGKEQRIPSDGNGEPYHYERASFTTPTGIGLSGWDWQNQRSRFVTLDLDGLNHANGLDEGTIADLIERLKLVDQVELIRSKSGRGVHARLYFDNDDAPFARIREDHTATAKKLITWLSGRMGIDLKAKADCVGVIAWVYHVDRQPTGFQLIKQATANVPAGWDSEFPNVLTAKTPEIDFDSEPVSPKHQQLIDWLALRGMGSFADGRLTTHTAALALAHNELKIKGSFATNATGKNLPSDRNCFAYPGPGDCWQVFRFGKAKDCTSHWRETAAGQITCILGKPPKIDVKKILAKITDGDDLFHDEHGTAYVTTELRGVRETIPVAHSLYGAKLRLAYSDTTGEIIGINQLRNFVGEQVATAELRRPQCQTAIRVADDNGKLYIDIANRERQIIEVAGGKWQIVSDCPVRFIRPTGMLPLPLPLKGGTLADLKRFVTVADDELPLLLAFVCSCFHPAGPYSLLQIVGEQGSAKSSLLRLLHHFIDPQTAIGSTLPRDERDALVSAQLRRLVSYDNVDALSRKLSSLLCMLVTGASSAHRRLFTDSEQCVLTAKRPIVLTSIGNVVTASDLQDRTLTISLPAIPAADRKSEYAIAAELREEGLRGRILGFILDGVAAAHAGHAAIKRNDMPRMADVFAWATAAEPSFGLEAGSAIKALQQQASEESAHIVDDSFAVAIAKLATAGWTGTAATLASVLPIHSTARGASNRLRELAPDLRRNGFSVVFRKSNGTKIIELSKQ
jgi:hypothetical protein